MQHGRSHSLVAAQQAGGPSTGGAGGKQQLKRADNYKLLYRAGRGSFGQVFKALDVTSQREVAAKVIDMDQGEDEISETMNEVTAMSQLVHANIVQYFTSFVEVRP